MAVANKPALKELTCPNCGTGLSQYTSGAQTIVCHNCGSYVTIGVGDPEVTGKSRRLPRPAKPVRIGKTITIEGTSYMVLGRVRYTGWDDEDRWSWDEWMIGSDDGRLLWLAYDEKGFSIYTKQRFREQFDPRTSMSIKIKDKNYPIVERYTARIVGAEGELTWRAKENERLYVAEGSRGGLRYSVQQTDEELEVYTGKAVSELDIAKSFDDKAWVRQVQARINRGENMRLAAGLTILFAIAALSLAIFTSAFGERVEQTSMRLAETQQSFPVNFNQAGRPALVNVSLNGALPENTFVDLDVSMVAPDGTESFLFTKSFWHETGFDEDGFWRETDYNENGMFVPLDSGEHRLMVTVPDNAPAANLTADVTIRRNVWVAQWFVGYAVVMGIVGVLMYMAAPSTK